MRRLVLASIATLMFAAAAMAGRPSTVPNETEWKRIQADYDHIAMLRRTIQSPSVSATRKEQIEQALDAEKKLQPLLDPFMAELREYFERTSDVRAAHLYSSEKVRLGDQYIDLLSRYDRAIAMYESALVIDPQNGDARAKLDKAQQSRFVSMEAFAGLHQGMRESEVRRLVGVPREDWIKQVVQKGRVYSVWIYPKKDGGASAVYFDGGVVYHVNWNAASAPVASASSGANAAAQEPSQ